MISIQTQLSKKLPIPGSDYSSQQASITISSECSDPSQVVAEAARLYALAEKAVDAQLAGAALVVPATPAATAPNLPPTTSVQRPSSSKPYQRRGPAPVTDNQMRFLERLIQQTGSSVPAILEQHQVGALRDLSCKAAAGLIDELKGLGVRS